MTYTALISTVISIYLLRLSLGPVPWPQEWLAAFHLWLTRGN